MISGLFCPIEFAFWVPRHIYESTALLGLVARFEHCVKAFADFDSTQIIRRTELHQRACRPA